MSNSEFFLTDVLATAAQDWVRDFQSDYGLAGNPKPDDLTEKEWEYVLFLDSIAEDIVEAAKSVQSDSPLHKVLELFRSRLDLDLKHDKFFRQCLEARFAEDIEDEIDHMGQRAVELMEYIATVNSNRARAYLARVGSCYLRGMDVETVVMCGAVLDAALQEAVTNDEVRSVIKGRKTVMMGERIQYFRITGAWDEDTADLAAKIAHDRNTAIHTVPGINRSVHDVLRDLAAVLNRIPNAGGAV